MKRGTLIRTIFVLGIIVGATVAALESSWTGRKLCEAVERRAPQLAPGVTVRIGQCRVEPLDLGLELTDVAVDLPNQPKPTIAAGRAEVRLSILQALWSALRIDRVELEKPQVNLDLSKLELPPPDPNAPKTNRCEGVDALQKVDIGQLQVSGGTVHVDLPGGRALDLAALGVKAKSRHGVMTLRVTQEGGKITVPKGVVPLDKIALTTELDAPAASLEVQRLQVEGGQLQVLARGSVQNLCDPVLNVEGSAGVPLDLVNTLVAPEGVKVAGYVTANASVVGKLDAPTAHAEVDVTDLDIDVAGNDVNPKDLSASIDLTGDEVRVSQLAWPFPDGVAEITASLTRKGNWPLTVSADAHGIAFGELLNRLPLKHPWVDFTGAVKAPKLVGHVFPTPTLAGPASVDITDFHVRTRAWDAPAQKDDEVLQIKRAHVDTEFNFTPDRIKLTRTRLTTERGAASVDATMSTDVKKGLDLSGAIDRFDLAEFGPIVGLPWSGTGSAKDVRITGAYGLQVIDGALAVKDMSFAGVHPGDLVGAVHFDPTMTLVAKDIVATKGKTTYRGHGLLDFSKKGGPEAAGALTIDQGRIEDALEILHDVHWSFEMFRGEMTGGLRGTIALEKGPVLAPTSDIKLKLRDVVCYDRPLGDADFEMLTEDGETITVPDVTVRGQTGRFVFGGHQQVGGALDFHLKVDDVPVAVATAPELEDWAMTGTLSGGLTIRGTQQQPEIRGEVYGADLTMFGVAAGQGHVLIDGVGTAMQVTGKVGDDVTLWSRMRWENDLPIEAKLTFDVTDLYKYVPTRTEWSDVTGAIAGTLALHGTMKDSHYAGSYQFSKVEFAKGDYTEENAGPVRLDFDGDRYELKSFSFRGHGAAGTGSQTTELSLTGTRTGDDDELDLVARGSVDAKLFETLSPGIESSSGRVDLAATITGTQDAPRVLGTLDLKRGKLKLRDAPVTLDGMDGQIQFSQASIDISRLKGTLNGGSLDVAGSVALKHFKPSSYDMRLAMDGAKFRLNGLPTTTLQGDLYLSGKASDPVVGGSLTIQNFVYDEDFSLQKLIANATRSKTDAAVYTKRDKVVRFAGLTVGFDENNDVEVRNNLVRTKLEGKLDVLGDDAHPNVRGSISALPGGYAVYRDNRFNLDRLEVQFRDSERITPEFDIHATTVARDYNITMHAFGTPDDSTVEFSSTPSLSQTDIVTLLTLGFTSQDRSTGSGSGTATALGADILSSVTGLDEAASRFIPKNKILRDPSFHLTSAYSQALGSMQPTAQIEGKIISDNVRLRLQEPVVAGGRGFKMQGEYKFTQNGSVQVQLDRDNSDYNFPDIGADLKLRWEMK